MFALSPYSIAIIGTAIIWASLLVFLKSARWRIILIGLLVSPLAIIDRTTIPGYWQPHPLYLSTNLSAVIFTFFLAGIAVEFFCLVSRKLPKHQKIGNIVLLGPLILAAAITIFLLNLNGMYFVIASLLTVFGLSLTLLRKNRHQIILTGMFFCIFYTVSFHFWQILSPDSRFWWNQKDLFGKIYFGYVPLGEILFSFLFGANIAAFQFLIPHRILEKR